MKLVVAFVAAMACASMAEASDALKAVVGSYLEIQAQLAADKIDGIKAPAAAIAAQAASLPGGGGTVAEKAKALELAADLKAARAAFGPLSDAVIAAAKAEDFKDLPDVKVAYCSMADASWLQKEPTIRNPYYGSSMLTCGEFKK